MHLARKSVDTGALVHNYTYLKSVSPQTRVLAVVKADAYGHGLIKVARALSAARCDGFAVTVVAEGLALRDAGVTQTVLVMQGAADADELRAAAARDLALVVHCPEQLALLERQGGDLPALWVKFDTGMGRLGFACADAAEVTEKLKRLNGGVREPVLMSHFACAGEPGMEHDDEAQWRRFERLLQSQTLSASIANSAAFLARPESRLDWARVGVALYGAPPECASPEHRRALKPVMRVTAPLVAVRSLRAGDRIGYGGAYVCPRDMRVGVVGVGYGGCYPRGAGEGTPVRVGGSLGRVVGRVSMDMVTVELDPGAEAAVGDEVELWGPSLPVAEVAAHCGTISYELLCAARGIEEA